MSRLYYLSQSPCTQDELQPILLQEKLNSAGVYTFRQTKGRGQYGNLWETSEDLNIAYSLAVSCDDIRCDETLFNFHTAVTLQKFLAKLTKSEVEIKWPNDIIIKNKKISGLLAERQKIGGIDFYIIGIGINVLQSSFPGLPKAGSLLSQTGISVSLHDFAQNLHNYLSEYIFEGKSSDEILKCYNENLFRKNKISVFETQDTRENGIIKSCSSDGRILIELERGGMKKFSHKEISLLY